VIAIAKAKGLTVIERHIQKEELSTFTECFIVGTAAEVTPVSEIGEFTFKPAALSLGLMDDYARLVRNEAPAAVPA
jgi:branched-chain amino acid aminotransferase